MTINDKIGNEKLQYYINGEAAKCRHYHLERLIHINILQVKKYYLSIKKKKMIEKARSNYSPLGRSLEKQTKTIKDQGKKQIIAVDDHGKQLVEYNELIEKDFNIHRDSISVDKVKRYLMNLLKKELILII